MTQWLAIYLDVHGDQRAAIIKGAAPVSMPFNCDTGALGLEDYDPDDSDLTLISIPDGHQPVVVNEWSNGELPVQIVNLAARAEPRRPVPTPPDAARAPDAPQAEHVPPPPLPDGDYAIVEVLGHRTMVGRVTEVERFGTRLLAIEPIFDGKLLPEVLVGGSSIYQFTACSAAVAARRAPTKAYQLPPSVAATLTPAALPAPQVDEDDDEVGDWEDTYS